VTTKEKKGKGDRILCHPEVSLLRISSFKGETATSFHFVSFLAVTKEGFVILRSHPLCHAEMSLFRFSLFKGDCFATLAMTGEVVVIALCSSTKSSESQ
jgi:hypothetical protein